MGRLLRKRASVPKKKKSLEGEDSSPNSSNRDANSIASTAVAAVPERKSDVPAASKMFALPKPDVTNFEKGRVGQIVQFFREVKLELKKVIWPSRKQTIGSTAVVIALVVIISIFLGVIDIGLSTLITAILQ